MKWIQTCFWQFSWDSLIKMAEKPPFSESPSVCGSRFVSQWCVACTWAVIRISACGWSLRSWLRSCCTSWLSGWTDLKTTWCWWSRRTAEVQTHTTQTKPQTLLSLQTHSLSLSLFCVTEKRVLQPHDSIYSESLVAPGRLIACRRDLSEILVGQTMSTLHRNCVWFWALKPESSSVMVFVSLSRPWLNVLSWDRSPSGCWVSTRGTWPWLLPTSTGISSTPSTRWSFCQTVASSLNQLLNDTFGCYQTYEKPLWWRSLSLLLAARADLLHVQPSGQQWTHGGAGVPAAALQWGAAVGDVRGAAVSVARETSPAAQEVHQDRCSVSLCQCTAAEIEMCSDLCSGFSSVWK